MIEPPFEVAYLFNNAAVVTACCRCGQLFEAYHDYMPFLVETSQLLCEDCAELGIIHWPDER